MSQEIKVKLDPKIVQFFYHLFKGDELVIPNRNERVKNVEIDISSSIGKYIRSACVKTNKPAIVSSYNMVLKVQDLDGKRYQGSIYQYTNGKRNFLTLPEQFVTDLNELMRDMMHTSLYYYLQGVESCGGCIAEGIRNFMDMHDLWEVTFSSSVERMYMRDKTKELLTDNGIKIIKSTPYQRFAKVNRSERKSNIEKPVNLSIFDQHPS